MYEANEAELVSPGRMFGFCKCAEWRFSYPFTVLKSVPMASDLL